MERREIDLNEHGPRLIGVRLGLCAWVDFAGIVDFEVRYHPSVSNYCCGVDAIPGDPASPKVGDIGTFGDNGLEFKFIRPNHLQNSL